MRILFMGTPDFALESLKALYEAKYDIIGVVTNIDKPKGTIDITDTRNGHDDRIVEFHDIRHLSFSLF